MAHDDLTPGEFDIVVITDLRFPGGTTSSLIETHAAAVAAGYRMAVLHLANPRLGTIGLVHKTLRALCESGDLTLLMPGEPVRAALVMVRHPGVFIDPVGGSLPIQTDRVVITVGQVPHDGSGDYYDPIAVDNHISEALDTRPTWAPVSPVVRAALKPYDLLVDHNDWPEIIDIDLWRSSPAQQPADKQGLVVGRHSRPDALKWPKDGAELVAAYPSDGSVKVRVLGGADAVADVLGAVPEAWEVYPFGSMAPAEFLAGLDAFVYFHHPDLVEAFGRTILEAIASRTVAVVPAHFAATFGPACLYATPQTAIATVRDLLANPQAHRDHLDAAEQFINERFSHQSFQQRLHDLLGEPKPQPAPRASPVLANVPLGLRRSYSTTMIVCLGMPLRQVKKVLVALDHQRRHAPGFIPILIVTITRPELADELGIETRIVSSRRTWGDNPDSWVDYAQGRLRQIASHYGVDNVVVPDLAHDDAWIGLQLRSGLSNP